MKKILILCLIMTFIVVGCSATNNNLPDKPFDMTGLIYELDTENQRILVVSNIDNVDIPYEEWSEGGNSAAFFKITEKTIINFEDKNVDFSTLEEGQKVEVWHTGVLAESYPMQGEAVYIKIVD